MSRSGELLRLATAGSVDDGKSTLIGRLLYDSKALMADEMARAEVDLAHLIDGLRAEREQGITIDVAYRFFATPRRSFIIADTPGHVRYTRNMVTGASTADAALVLIDARNGIIEQSRRHASIASLLGIRHLIACVNKMDLVDCGRGALPRDRVGLRRDGRAARDRRRARDPDVGARGRQRRRPPRERMPWYDGPPLLAQLEQLEVAEDRNLEDVRFPVQLTIRDTDYRGYAGRVAGGVLRTGDEVVVLPAGETSTIARIDTPRGPAESVEPPLTATVVLADELDVGRGDMIVSPGEPARRRPPHRGDGLLDGTRRRCARARATSSSTPPPRARDDRGDPVARGHGDARLGRAPGPSSSSTTSAKVRLRTTAPLLADPYSRNRVSGAFILVDETTFETGRRGHDRDGHRGGGPARPARTAPTSSGTTRRCRGASAGTSSACAARRSGSPACRARASRRSARSSSGA